MDGPTARAAAGRRRARRRNRNGDGRGEGDRSGMGHPGPALLPVLQSELLDSAELVRVMSDERRAVSQRDRCYQKIVGTDDLALALQARADLAVNRSGRIIKRQRDESAGEDFSTGEVLGDPGALHGAVKELRLDDRAEHDVLWRN